MWVDCARNIGQPLNFLSFISLLLCRLGQNTWAQNLGQRCFTGTALHRYSLSNGTVLLKYLTIYWWSELTFWNNRIIYPFISPSASLPSPSPLLIHRIFAKVMLNRMGISGSVTSLLPLISVGWVVDWSVGHSQCC